MKHKTARTLSAFERLESRTLLAVDPASLLAKGFEPIEWNGQTVYAKPNQYVVQLGSVKGSAKKQLADANAALAAGGAADKGLKATRALGRDGLLLVESTGGGKKSFADAKAALKRVKDLQRVEPDFAVWSTATTPNDTYYGRYLYGLNNAGQTGGTPDADIDAPEAWDLARGDGSVVVGVIDSGVDYTHPDLSANMWRNPGEIAGNARDDDGNGYVDDVYGWDFASNDATPIDENGHGTHVAGTIAAAGNNATGVSGVNWNAKVMALKFLTADGTGTTSGAIAAINYATRMRRDFGINVRVTNNSWGGGGYSTALYDAIRNHAAAGILFVAAAGNGGADGVGDNTDQYPEYPAAYNVANVLSVAATDHNDRLAGFSNFGATSVDLAAPGVSIVSTVPGSGYAYMSGTSMATPHVAGVAALAWSYNPAASYTTVKNAILTGTDKLSTLSGKTVTGGRLNAHRTLLNMPSPLTTPAAPSSLAAAAVSGTQVNLTWVDNGSNEDGFKIERSTDGVNFTQVATAGAGATGYSDTGRSPATTYKYRVRAYNTAGDSAYSNTATATTADTVAPSAPSGLAVTGTTASSASLTWAASSDNVAVAGYRVFRDGTAVGTTAATSYTDNGLTTARSYAYTVAAYDAAGNVSDTGNVATAVTPADTSAVFVKADTTTQGTWKGVYGADGYALAGDGSSLPAYARLSISGQSQWTWAEVTADARALQKAGTSTDREASTWYSGTSFVVDLDLTDGQSHQVGLYALDWDHKGRIQTVEVSDAVTGKVLDARTVSSFQDGQHLIWELAGHVRLRVANAGGVNTVLSGLFFDAEQPAPTPAGSAVFVKTDAMTQGTWKGTYGAGGYALAGDGSSRPSYAELSISGQSQWTWSEVTADVRALQKAGATTDREASTWYSASSFIVDLNLTDGRSHQVGLYALDWDRKGRVQTFEVSDAATGQVLDIRTISDFGNGQHLVWNLSGHVRIRVSRADGPNAVLSGLFFDEPPTVAAAAATSPFSTSTSPADADEEAADELAALLA